MYYSYFGMEEAPFKITPDTRLFYEGGKRGDILAALCYAITSGEGIVKVVGEVGSGKTMLSRMLEVRLSDNIEIVYLANPSISPDEIAFAIDLELGLQPKPELDRISAVHILQRALLERHAAGKRVVCFIEEAQSMPLATLEEIRLLSNLETHRDKLLQIVLFGQPELDEHLNEPSIRQLRERIAHSLYLHPLGVMDVGSYLSFRMRAVGYRGADVFTRGACKALSRASAGLIRRVNILGDKALLAAFADDTRQVDVKHVKTAIRDSEFGRLKRPLSLAKFLVIAAAVLLAAGVGAVFTHRVPESQQGSTRAGGQPEERVASLSKATALNNTATSMGAVSLLAVADEPVPLTQAGANTAVTGGGDALQLKPEGKPLGGEVAAVKPTVDKPAADEVTLPAQRPQPQQVLSNRAALSVGSATATQNEAVMKERESRGAVSRLRRPGVSGDTGIEPRFADSARQASRAMDQGVSGVPADMSSSLDPTLLERVVTAGARELAMAKPMFSSAALLESRLAATRHWLSDVDKNRFSIRVFFVKAADRPSVEHFFEQRNQVGDASRMFVYLTVIEGTTGYMVLFDEYKNMDAAKLALKHLPKSLKRYRPSIQSVADIKLLETETTRGTQPSAKS